MRICSECACLIKAKDQKGRALSPAPTHLPVARQLGARLLARRLQQLVQVLDEGHVLMEGGQQR